VFYFLSYPYDRELGRASNGTLDLRGEQMNETLFTLGGDWEFYYGKLLTPADFASGEAGDFELISVPSDWSREGYPLYGCATYRLKLKTDESSLALFVPEIPNASAVFINGETVFRAGTVSSYSEGFSSSLRNELVTFETSLGEAEIIIQAANFNWAESGLRYDLLVGRAQVLFRDQIARRIVLAAFIGAVLLMGLYHAALFISNRREKIYAVFALICLVQAVRFFLETNGFAQLLLPQGMNAALLWVYLSLIPLGTALIVVFTHLAFGIKFPPGRRGKLWKGFYALAILGCAPLVILKGGVYIMAALTFLPMVVLFIAGIRSKKATDKPFMGLYLAAIGLFCVWGVLTKLIWGDRLYMAGVVSNLFLLLSQCVLLALDYGRARRQAAELAAQNLFLDNLLLVKTQYLANLTREMKTPLTVISLNLQRALRNLPEAEGVGSAKSRESLFLAKEETMKVAELAQTALDMALVEEFDRVMTALDPASLLRKSADEFRPLADERGCSLTLSLPTKLPSVLGDATLLARAMSNLLSNAIAATQQGRVEISAEAGQEFVTVSVTDDGAGIPESLVGHEFDRGVSGSGGMGLGLYITREIIRAHGGTIRLSASASGGTKAEFTLRMAN
jgi:signal transduction histidine kinase